MVPFNYSELQLGPNTTRLVRLLPSEKDDTPIRCELITYILPESTGRKHLYEALSYVWGSQCETHTITVNGCDLHVTRNLYTALVHLRDNQLERILWIDAICINQEDDDEKSEQIPLMRSIYAQADRVVVWLGEAMRDGDDALKIIQRLAGESSLWRQGSFDPCCLRLLRRDWFQRTWVRKHSIKEVIYANLTSWYRYFGRLVSPDVFPSSAVPWKSMGLFSVKDSKTAKTRCQALSTQSFT